jgi:hypothetical protein
MIPRRRVLKKLLRWAKSVCRAGNLFSILRESKDLPIPNPDHPAELYYKSNENTRLKKYKISPEPESLSPPQRFGFPVLLPGSSTLLQAAISKRCVTNRRMMRVIPDAHPERNLSQST